MIARAGIGLLCVCLCAAATDAGDPAVWFAQANRYDLGNGAPRDAGLAFTWFRRAADAGLPEAEFNVAAMLDSGRGVERDVGQAATWYARAATHGNRRAAFNLGQLYQAGEGVPRNPDLARLWFAASDLPAARARLASLRPQATGATAIAPPVPAFPATAEHAMPGASGLELVWTSAPQPEPVRYFVELRALGLAGPREVFTGSSDTSAMLAKLPDDAPGDYAWRVLAAAPGASHYAASEWVYFSVGPE